MAAPLPRAIGPALSRALPCILPRRSSALVLHRTAQHPIAQARESTNPLAPMGSRRFHQSPPRQSQNTLLPEFSLKEKVIIVSGGARGVGLTQAEGLLEAGAIVHALDRLPVPDADSDFARVAARAKNELGSSLMYHRVDVRDQKALNEIVSGIANETGHIDGLIAAAGIQQETPALEYSAEDADKMLGVNVTGVFMTAQAVARQMIERKQKGSLVLIGSMSGTVANRGLICP